MFYQFENDRKYDRASDYLEGFNGVIQSDGYQAYANIEDVKNMGCFAHLRRKLVEVMDVAPKGIVIKETQTYKMYQLINKLFYLEKVYDKKYKKDYDRITKERKIKSLPVLEESMPWSEELPKNLYKNKKAEKYVLFEQVNCQIKCNT